jgi:hypothetical protein
MHRAMGPERGGQSRCRRQVQIDGSRTDDDNDPSTHSVANAIPISPNVSMMASPSNAAKTTSLHAIR